MMGPPRHATKWARETETLRPRGDAASGCGPCPCLPGCWRGGAPSPPGLPPRPPDGARAPRDICCPQAARPDVVLIAEAVLSPSKAQAFFSRMGREVNNNGRAPSLQKRRSGERLPHRIFFFFFLLHSLSFLVKKKKKGISNSRARASLMPFDGD